ncbi:MAG: T9SS type A sorting domain-containing protein, partial [Marinilabiliaceae bacterium]|nr:T9SS type A sorting domain-containing protein [Marinilabiliaceae bacterium]
TDAATDVLSNGATLNATVNANNSETTVTFEYGLTTAYGTTITADESPLSGLSATPVTAAISALNPNATYHFRVLATNSEGTSNGEDLTFTTLKYDQVITFAELPDKETTDIDFDPGATSSLGLEISYTSSDELVATIVNNMVHLVGAGTTTIIAYQTGNDTVNAATPVEQSLTVTEGTGVNEAQFANLRMYPNPVKDLLTIDIEKTIIDKVEISIIDLKGEVIFHKYFNDSKFQINTDTYNPGIYIIEVKTSNGSKKLKLLIE